MFQALIDHQGNWKLWVTDDKMRFKIEKKKKKAQAERLSG